MRKINLSEIPDHERKSPTGKYHARYKEISLALGRDRDSLDGWPFRCEVPRRLRGSE
jgi:hypothetical protein